MAQEGDAGLRLVLQGDQSGVWRTRLHSRCLPARTSRPCLLQPQDRCIDGSSNLDRVSHTQVSLQAFFCTLGSHSPDVSCPPSLFCHCCGLPITILSAYADTGKVSVRGRKSAPMPTSQTHSRLSTCMCDVIYESLCLFLAHLSSCSMAVRPFHQEGKLRQCGGRPSPASNSRHLHGQPESYLTVIESSCMARCLDTNLGIP